MRGKPRRKRKTSIILLHIFGNDEKFFSIRYLDLKISKEE